MISKYNTKVNKKLWLKMFSPIYCLGILYQFLDMFWIHIISCHLSVQGPWSNVFGRYPNMSFIRYSLEHLGSHRSKDCFFYGNWNSKLWSLSSAFWAINLFPTQKPRNSTKTSKITWECMFKSAIPNSIDSSHICLPVLLLLRTTGVWAAQSDYSF